MESDVPVAELLPLVKAWLKHAGHKTIALSDNSFNEFRPEEAVLGELARDAIVSPGGFSPARWLFWRQRLQVISQCDDESVAKDALISFRMMSQMLLKIESAVYKMVNKEYVFKM